MSVRLSKTGIVAPALPERDDPVAGRRAAMGSIARLAVLAALPGLAACGGHSHGGVTYVTAPHPPEYYRYYYYPHAGVYYHIATGYYFYYFNGAWRRARTRPRYIYLDDRHRTIIVIREGQPYDHNEAHQRKFGPPRPDRYGRGPGPARPEGPTQNAGWGKPQDGQPHPRDYGQSQGQQGGQGQSQGQHAGQGQSGNQGQGQPWRPPHSQGNPPANGQVTRPPQSQGQHAGQGQGNSQGQNSGHGRGGPAATPASTGSAPPRPEPRGNGQGRPDHAGGNGRPPTRPECPEQANGKGRC